MAAGALLGAIIGAAVAYLGATRAFVCRDDLSTNAACAEPSILLALAWAVPIGLAIGLVLALLVAHRRS